MNTSDRLRPRHGAHVMPAHLVEALEHVAEVMLAQDRPAWARLVLDAASALAAPPPVTTPGPLVVDRVDVIDELGCASFIRHDVSVTFAVEGRTLHVTLRAADADGPS